MADSGNHKGTTRSRAALVAALLAFAISQILIVAHGAKYGDGPHEHMGQTCVLSLAAPGGDKFVAAASFVFAAALVLLGFSLQATQLERARIPVRAARPRGPPSL